MVTNFHKAGISLDLNCSKWEIKEFPDDLFMFIDNSIKQRFLIIKELEAIEEKAIKKIKFIERAGLSIALWSKTIGVIHKDYLALKGAGKGVLLVEAVSSDNDNWGINTLKKFSQSASLIKIRNNCEETKIDGINIKALKYPEKHGYGCHLDLLIEGTANTIWISGVQMTFQSAGINRMDHMVFFGDRLLMHSSTINDGKNKKPFSNIFSGEDSFHFCYESAGRPLNNYDSIIVRVTAFSFSNWGRIAAEKVIKVEELELSTIDLPITEPVFFLNTAGSQSLHYDSVNKRENKPFFPQQFAVDIIDERDLVADENNNTNEDYHSYGKQVLSIDEGIVIEAVCVHKDNLPGKYDLFNVAGNYIIIKHQQNVFSFYAHLREKSLKIKKGESVKALQVIAESGNSGYSTMPHLHFQLSRGASPLEDISIPFLFKNIGWPR